MADNLLRYGLKWVGSLLPGANGAPKSEPLRVATSYNGAINGGSAVDINIGDAIRRTSSGTIEHAEGSEASGGTADTISHVVVGVGPYWDGTKMVFGTKLPNSNNWGTVQERSPRIFGIPVFGQIFEICCDDKVTATTEAAYIDLIGNNADHILVTGSEPKTNLLLDISSAGTGAAQWRILGISPSVENLDFAGNYVRLLVTCNETQALPGTFSTTGV